MSKRPRLSICMIVRDEEAVLARCLNSVEALGAELVVVDTGSTDGSKALCRAFHAEVFPFDWRDDFAAARNHGLERAAGDWIFWLDADEALCAEDPETLLEELRRAQKDVLSLDMCHYHGAAPPEATRSFHTASHRIFRNGRGIRFTGRIHEHLDLRPHTLGIADRPLTGAKLLHYGYMDEVVHRKDKTNRNLTLLQKAAEDTDDPWCTYHIAVEYYRRQDYPRAYTEVNQAIGGFLKRGLLPPALAYKLKYELLLNCCPDDGALAGLEKALQLYPDYVDLHYYRGLMLLRQERYAAAGDCFTRCLALGEKNPAYLTLVGTGSFYALFYLGVCQESLGERERAKDAYAQALVRCPGFQEAARRLDAIHSIEGSP